LTYCAFFCIASAALTYAVIQEGDQPVTTDTGEVRQPSKPRKILSPEHRANLVAGREAARAAKIGFAA
jgi:hypothetical protein